MGADVRLERTEDLELIRTIVRHPEIFPYICDDDENDYTFLHPRFYYLLVLVDEPSEEGGATVEIPAGLVAFIPVNAATWVPHVCLFQRYRGNGAGTQALAMGIEWMFENTQCRKLVARPPAYNAAMLRVFEKCGFHIEGASPKSWLRFGELHDRIYYGMEKE